MSIALWHTCAMSTSVWQSWVASAAEAWLCVKVDDETGSQVCHDTDLSVHSALVNMAEMNGFICALTAADEPGTSVHWMRSKPPALCHIQR